MPSAAPAFSASTDRPLNYRMRTDLVIEPQRYLGREYWVVKDPLSLRYYRFEEEEYSLLTMLDGSTSMQQLKRRFEHRFAPQTIGFAELHRFLGSLYRSSLLISGASGQGDRLWKRSRDQQSKQRWSWIGNLLSLRLRGFDPDRLLGILDRYIGWFFSVPMMLLTLLFMCAAGGLLLVQFDTLQQRLPEFRSFFAVQNWFWLAVTLAGTKVLHEFGHGLACKRAGGECHEMGVMLLVFTPCLYCNVSDAWMLPSKWKRAGISAAGMWVELALASLCTFVWWFTNPGFINSTCLNVMFVCSVTTLLFNANPLLKYDGYYILSDLIEIPNLRQKANATIRRKLGKWALGLPEHPDPFLPSRRRGFFALYAVAAAVYRWVVVFSIFWFVYEMLEPYGLKIVGQLLACTALYSLFVLPIVQLIRFFRVPGRVQRVKPIRLMATLGLFGIALASILCIPLPYWVECPVYVQPRAAKSVYVQVAGQLEAIHVRAGDAVEAGDPIITLCNDSIESSWHDVSGALAIEDARVHASHYLDAYQPGGESQTEQLLRSKETLREQLTMHELDMQRLVIRAPRSGIVIPAPHRAGRRDALADEFVQLDEWTGTPLDLKNRLAYLESGTLVAQIGDERTYEAVLVIDQENIELIQEAANVKIQLTQLGSELIETQVEFVSNTRMKEVPRSISAEFGGTLATERNGEGVLVPHLPAYQVLCPLQERNDWVAAGAIGRAKVDAGSRTIGWRLGQWAMRTFNFEL